LFEQQYFYNWTEDPYASGAYSYLGVGGCGAPEQPAQPVEGRLFFAGEAAAPHGQQGTVHGAIERGRQAAEHVLAGKPSS
jgi:monoamine oxidase